MAVSLKNIYLIFFQEYSEKIVEYFVTDILNFFSDYPKIVPIGFMRS